MHKNNWDDLRYVLAVAESGSVGAAARDLGVNHATVLRRIASFEEAQGGAVFRRAAAGYEVLPERLPVIEAARMAAAAVRQATGLMRGDPGGDRPVRITSTDSVCLILLPQVLTRLLSDPTVPRMTLRCSNNHRNLGRLEADITVRPSIALPSELKGELAGGLTFRVYGAKDAAPDEPWLGLGGQLAGSAAGVWLARAEPRIRPVLTVDSFPVLAELAAAGAGRTVLPGFLGDRYPTLKRDDELGVIATTPVWVASHVELAETTRLARLRRDLADALLETLGPL